MLVHGIFVCEDDHVSEFPEPGYYYLTKPVRNPKPDARSSRMAACRQWPARMRIQITSVSPDRLKIIFPDGSYIYAGETVTNAYHLTHGNILFDKIVPGVVTVGQVLESCRQSPAVVVAALVEGGFISLEDVLAKVMDINRWTDADIDEVKNQHEV